MTDLIQVHADLSGLAFSAMRQIMLHEAQEHDLPIVQNNDDHLMVGSELGAFGLTAKDDGIRLHVEAETDENLFVLRDSLIEHIVYFVPDVAEDIRWSDGPAAESLPPNFQFAEVLDRTAVGGAFYRLTLRPERIDTMSDSAIHVRFVLPARENTTPEWPRVQENGATKWPSGDKALHRPVYTLRSVDHGAGTVTVDVFRHDGGRAADWAQSVAVGEKVALTGPGGGGVVQVDEILLCGDETAYPAIARILDALPVHSRAAVFLCNHSGVCDYPMPLRDGVTLHWVTQHQELDLADHAISALGQMNSPFVWFAAENKVVSKLRKSGALAGIDKSRRYIAAYWTAET